MASQNQARSSRDIIINYVHNIGVIVILQIESTQGICEIASALILHILRARQGYQISGALEATLLVDTG